MSSISQNAKHLLAWSFGHKLLFVFPLINAQLHLTKRKMSSNGSANVKHSEAMSDKIVTAMSTACHRKKLHFPTWEIIGKFEFKPSNIGKSLGNSYRTNKIPITFQQR